MPRSRSPSRQAQFCSRSWVTRGRSNNLSGPRRLPRKILGWCTPPTALFPPGAVLPLTAGHHPLVPTLKDWWGDREPCHHI